MDKGQLVAKSRIQGHVADVGSAVNFFLGHSPNAAFDYFDACLALVEELRACVDEIEVRANEELRYIYGEAHAANAANENQSMG